MEDPPRSPEPSQLLSDRVTVSGPETGLTLSSDGALSWTSPEGRQCRLMIEKDVLGFDLEGSKIRVRAIVDTEVACCAVGGRGGSLIKKDLVFEPLSDESRSLWCQKLQGYLGSLGRPKRLLIFLNPFGGNGSAAKTFSNDVKPLLLSAGIQFKLQETQYRLHAKEVARSMDLSDYDGIVCVSGDGILVEVVNGLLERDDWEDAIKIPLGVVPAGTGNGMVKSLLDSVGQPCTAAYATLAIIRGHKRSLDVATVSQGEKKFFSVLMLAWGLIADIDIESEKYRWMGSARLDFYALQRIVRLRRYNGCISFVPAPGYETQGEPTNYRGDGAIKHDEERIRKLRGYQGPDLNLEELSWRSIDGPFISVWLHNVPWGGENTLAAPDAKFSDGYIDLIAIRDCPKMSLLSLLTELEKGGHVKSPLVMYLKVKAFILEPGSRSGDPRREGIIDVDGEVLARGKGTYRSEEKTLMSYGKLQITMDQGLATLFTPV